MFLTRTSLTVTIACAVMLVCGPSEEERAWAAATPAESIETYEAFVKQFPESKFSETASEHLGTLRDRASWEGAQRESTIAAYELHLATFPDSSFAEATRTQIQELKYPFSKQGYTHLLAADQPADYKCKEGQAAVPAGGVYIAEEDTHVSADDLRGLFHWNGVERAWRVPGDPNMAGITIDGQGRSVLFGNQCLGNLQLEGSVVSSDGLILKRNTRLLHP